MASLQQEPHHQPRGLTALKPGNLSILITEGSQGNLLYQLNVIRSQVTTHHTAYPHSTASTVSFYGNALSSPSPSPEAPLLISPSHSVTTVFLLLAFRAPATSLSSMFQVCNFAVIIWSVSVCPQRVSCNRKEVTVPICQAWCQAQCGWWVNSLWRKWMNAHIDSLTI